ncbi:MAG: succinyl-diaminopimelate desuccinylase [Legionella sp.]
MNELITLLGNLIQYPSITPNDAGCQDYLIHYLAMRGFKCQRFDHYPVSNFFAMIGDSGPLLLFAGHTDVVACGELSSWASDPFILREHNGMLYGRGTADMKGSIACMLVAASRFLQNHTAFNGRLGFLITSGEEGDDYLLGTPHVMSELQKQGIKPDFCIVGEPSSTAYTGDVIKIGRRGSLNGVLSLKGKQGHVAYPHLAINPIHQMIPPLAELLTIRWDQGDAYFPPTSLQITQLISGGESTNIIPADLALKLNFRYSTQHNAYSLQQRVHECFNRHALFPTIEWRISGEPFLTTQGELLERTIQSIYNVTGLSPELSTSGGTSDGRFIAPYGTEVVEVGPVNATIHQINECVARRDLEILADVYYEICCGLLSKA